MISATPTVVVSGDALELTVSWSDMAGDPETPDSVRYQVFDRSGESVSSAVDLSGISSSMTFVIPGANMPANSEQMRRLTIKMTGTFGTDQHTVHVPIVVKRSFVFN